MAIFVGMSFYDYRLSTKLGEGNAFSRVCLSFCLSKGTSLFKLVQIGSPPPPALPLTCSNLLTWESERLVFYWKAFLLINICSVLNKGRIDGIPPLLTWTYAEVKSFVQLTDACYLHWSGFPLRLENLENGKTFSSQEKVREKLGKITQNTGKLGEFEINIIWYF